MSFEEKDRNEDLFGFLFENDDYPCEDGELSTFNDMGTSEGKAEKEQDIYEGNEGLAKVPWGYFCELMLDIKKFTYDDMKKGAAYYSTFMQYVDIRTEDRYDEKIEIINDCMDTLLKEMSLLYEGSANKEEVEKFTKQSMPELYDTLGFPFENDREMSSALLKTRSLYPSCWSLDDIVKWVKLNHLFRGFSYYKDMTRIEKTLAEEKMEPAQYEQLKDKSIEMMNEVEKWHNLISEGNEDEENTEDITDSWTSYELSDDYVWDESLFAGMGTIEERTEEKTDEAWEYIVDLMQNKRGSFGYKDIEKGKAYYYAFMEYLEVGIDDYDERIEIVNDCMGGLLKEMSMLYKGSADKEEIEKFTEQTESELFNTLGFPFESNREMYEVIKKTRGLYPSCWSLDDIVKWIRLNHLYKGFSYVKDMTHMEKTMAEEKLKPVQCDYLSEKIAEMVGELDKWHNLILDNLREFKEKYVVEDDSPEGFSVLPMKLDGVDEDFENFEDKE